MHRTGRSTARRVAGLVVAAAVIAAPLAGCSSDAGSSESSDAVVPDRIVEIGQEFAGLGIATVPFAGGEPVYDVSGPVVLTLTDWQVSSIAANTPVAPENAGASRQWGGVSTASLDAINEALPALLGAEKLTPSALIQAWWRVADTARAAAARELVPAPTASMSPAIPTAVLALFVADGLADGGRVVDPNEIAVALGEDAPRILAMGPDGGVPVAEEPDACGTISSAIDSVNAFLDGMGEFGTLLRGAITEAAGAIDTLSGGVLSAVKRVIAVANLVLNTASLLTPWKLSLAVDPVSGHVVAFDKMGSTGTKSKVTVRLDGVAATAPPGVQSCLSLLGIVDPTSQQGSDLTWGSFDGYVDNVSPSLITPPAEGGPGQLGADNTASVDLGTGTENSSAKKFTPAVESSPSISVSVERADVKKLTSWIRSQDTSLVQSVLGGTLEAIATAVELSANPDMKILNIPVGYWVPDETPDPEPVPADQPPDAQPPADPPGPPGPKDVNECLEYSKVEQVTKLKISKVVYGEWEGMDQPFVPGEKIQACKYYVGTTGAMVVIEDPFFLSNSDAATDAGFLGILTDRNCNLASGLLDTGANMTSYFVYSGVTLGGTFFYQTKPSNAKNKLRNLAKVAGLC